ncbi:MAG: GNAT family N-acetyltransferase [Fimbriimonadaceae bacterium]|jgi:GNAT superfamily N-acetyltransferase|nr:GNAT family N-acetyltransferase [Fimbriimonadaceae bacterium]
MGESLLFTPNYFERLRLPKGLTVYLRHVRPEDKSLYVEGLKRYSKNSFYFRFMSAKTHFTEAELAYLTEVDQWNHLCLVAGSGPWDKVVGLASGRFVRFKDDPTTAEFALFVGDSYQRYGLGRAIMLRLMYAAKEREVQTLFGEMFRDNSAMFHLVDSLPVPANWELEGPVARMTLSLECLPPAEELLPELARKAERRRSKSEKRLGFRGKPSN